MIASSKDAPAPRLPFPGDVAEFHLRWTEFRPHAVAALSVNGLTPEQAETLRWMIALSDRVGGLDLEN
jgi:hypothetical protein